MNPIARAHATPRTAAHGAWLALLIALILTPLAGAALPAHAHDVLIDSDPASGSTVDAMPEKVTLEFNNEIITIGATIVATGPDGSDIAEGEPQISGNAVTQALTGDAQPGEYQIAWRVVSSDGHPIQGLVTFTLAGDDTAAAPQASASPTQPAATAASATPSADTTKDTTENGTSAVWIAVLVAGILTVVVGGLLFLRKRQ